MKEYVNELGLAYDPFAPGVQSKDFFAGGERRLIADQIIELSLDGNTLAAVTGPLGSGKTTIGREVCNCFGTDAVCVFIPATLFMNQVQFLDALGRHLPKHKHIAPIPDLAAGVQRLRQYAVELDLEAQSLIMVVDNAQELSAEVIELIDDIVSGTSKSCIRAILLGENQLINLLQNTLSEASQAILVHFALPDFDAEDTKEYLRFKLGSAGYREELPRSGGVIGQIHNSANGLPGAINALMADSLSGDLSAMSETYENEFHFDGGELADNEIAEQFNFGAHENQQIDLDMADPDEDFVEDYPDGEEIYQEESEEIEQHTPLTGYLVDHRFSIAATFLAAIMLITLLAWNTDEGARDSSEPQLANASNGGNVNRIQLAPPIPIAATPVVQADLAQPVNTVVAAANTITTAITTTAPVEPVINTILTAEPAVVVTAGKTTSNNLSVPSEFSTAATASTSTTISKTAAPSVAPSVATTAKPAAKPAASSNSNLSGFEKELMRYAANTYTIQILGSHSEANVKKFVTDKALTQKHGYYETRHENKPWFVVVAGNFRDRAAANAVIDQLPASLRSMQPWIRSVADVQRDIRKLNNL